MIFFIATAITNLFGIDFAAAQKWARRFMLLVVVLVVIVPAAIIYTRCSREKPVSPEKVREIQDAIASGDRKRQEEKLAEIEGDVAAADKSVLEADTAKINAMAEAKKKAEGMSNAELAAELERLAK